jgi:ATP-binding protein involved in chromosome partitioning
MSQSPANTPTNIKAERDAGRVTIDWADGHHSQFNALELRLQCPCAFCKGEAGRPGWLDTNPTLTPEQTQLVSMRLVGSYAIAPTWSDGHDTGYYTFEALRANCPCDACATDLADSH